MGQVVLSAKRLPDRRRRLPSLGRLASGLLVFSSFLPLTGCQRQTKLQTPAVVRNSPEAKFDWIIQRLERALELGKPSLAGIQVERKVSYNLQKPAAPDESYTARVVINTNTKYSLPTSANRNRSASPDEEGGAPSALESVGISDPLASLKKGHQPMSGNKKPRAKSDVTVRQRARLGASSRVLQEERIFDFAHLDGQWQLQTDLESETERLWFDYAMQK